MEENSRQIEATGYAEEVHTTGCVRNNINYSVADNHDSVNGSVTTEYRQGHLPLFVVVDGKSPFPGYKPLGPADTTYLYNQFFSEVVPHSSLCCIRLIAYMAYYTTRRSSWVLESTLPALAQALNCSERSVYNALKESIASGFVICRREPQRKVRGCPTLPGIWSLKLTGSDTRVEGCFTGFYSGNKYRTPTPNDFLLDTVMKESLIVIKYLACVIRYTVGFSNEDGTRRLTVEIGMDRFLRESGIGNKTRFTEARKLASCYAGYIQGASGRMVYGLSWSEAWNGDRSKIGTPEPGKNGTPNLQERYPDPGKNGTPIAANMVPPLSRVDPGKIGTPLNRVPSKQGLGNRQQKLVDKLMALGMDQAGAAAVCSSCSEEVITKQIEYFSYRKPEKNPGGMLRKSIEEDWTPPPSFVDAQKKKAARVNRRLKKEVGMEEKKHQTEWEARVDGEWAKMENTPEWKGFKAWEEKRRSAGLSSEFLKSNPSAMKKIAEVFDSRESRRKRVAEYFGIDCPISRKTA